MFNTRIYLWYLRKCLKFTSWPESMDLHSLAKRNIWPYGEKSTICVDEIVLLFYHSRKPYVCFTKKSISHPLFILAFLLNLYSQMRERTGSEVGASEEGGFGKGPRERESNPGSPHMPEHCPRGYLLLPAHLFSIKRIICWIESYLI